MKNIRSIALALLLLASSSTWAQNSIDTERQYLSGHGCDDMVQWDFFCTDGRNSGKWTKIGVPSCWETQGFGTFQYGMRFYGKARPEGIADEVGKYKYEFTLPKAWEGRQIQLVFEASMTDTKVDINGRKAVGLHQGGFYRFTADVSDRIFFGNKKNSLEVTVNKESADNSVNMAERRGDYWNFGGIIRPVFVVSKPAENIDRVAINATMDGQFNAWCYLNRAVAGAKVKTEILDKAGKKVGETLTDARGSDQANISFSIKNPLLWSAETPNLYTAVFSLIGKDGKTLHRERQKFGFRTIEVRESDGLYVNGVKVMLRGVNRHSFRPETGRTLSKAKNIEDVQLIRSMNMNAVRLSHYPADPEFYEACDSIGLYVMDELLGWHAHYTTVVGRQLVEEMIKRDVNHPSIIFWSNGNEGGFNYELEPTFTALDPQKRTVIYPWSNRNGFETMHYRSYGESQDYMRKPEIWMPTEFLHGLYDGGHGAGLYDYWQVMMKAPRCAGGFLWDLADEGVVRNDMGGIIDNQGNFGADGIVGPHHEKEGSYYAIKEVWCPIQILNDCYADFNGQLNVENRYAFINLRDCKLKYTYASLPASEKGSKKTLKTGTVNFPDIAPQSKGVVSIPKRVDGANVLDLTVIDNRGEELFTWSNRLTSPFVSNKASGATPTVEDTGKSMVVKAGQHVYSFSKETGLLEGVKIKGNAFSLKNGPRFIAAKRSDRSLDQFYNHDDKDAEKKKTEYTVFEDKGKFAGFKVEQAGDSLRLIATYRLGSFDKAVWTFLADGRVRLDYAYNFGGVVDLMGVMFDYPEENVKSKTWTGDGPYRVWQNRTQGPQYGLWQNEYNDPIPGESFTYPEFKGYFQNVDWMTLKTSEGSMRIDNLNPAINIGVYTPRDGRDHILYTLPNTGISLLKVIPAVRNKVNTTDLNGPSAQPYWANGEYEGTVWLNFE